MSEDLDAARLLAVIETQNELAATALDLDAVMGFVADRARALSRADGCVIEVPEGGEMVHRVGSGTAARHVGLRVDLDATLSGRCVAEGRVLRCDDARVDRRFDGAVAERLEAISMVCVPLRHGDQVAGALTVSAGQPNAFDDDDETLLGLLSGVVAAHMAHASAYAMVQRQSRQDSLTGLGNRRAFEEDLAQALRLAERKGRPLGLAVFDVDRFKEVNDHHGHPTGDAVLVEVASVLASGRAGDRAYRLGGDEFALVMPETTRAGAEVAVRRAKAAIDSARAGGLPVTVSVGCAERIGEAPDELFAAADAALYEAKARRPRSS